MSTAPLFSAWAAMGASNEPRHSRSAAKARAMLPSAGIVVHPCGWMAAKISATTDALISQLQRRRR